MTNPAKPKTPNPAMVAGLPVGPAEGAAPTKKPKRIRAEVDWDAIEPDVRAGILSWREIAAKHKGIVSHVAIKNRAEKFGWTRDLAPKIKAKAQEGVDRATAEGLNSALNTSLNSGTAVKRMDRMSEATLIENVAVAIVRVRMEHRKDIQRGRNVFAVLMDRLEATANAPEFLEALGQANLNPDKNGNDKMFDTYQKVIALPGLVKTMKDAADTLKTLIGLERESYGLDEVKEPGANDGRTSIPIEFVASTWRDQVEDAEPVRIPGAPR